MCVHSVGGRRGGSSRSPEPTRICGPSFPHRFDRAALALSVPASLFVSSARGGEHARRNSSVGNDATCVVLSGAAAPAAAAAVASMRLAFAQRRSYLFSVQAYKSTRKKSSWDFQVDHSEANLQMFFRNGPHRACRVILAQTRYHPGDRDDASPL